MASSLNGDLSTSFQPFTLTNDVDTATLANIFNTMSDNFSNKFTATSDLSDASALMSRLSGNIAQPTTLTTSVTPSGSLSSATAASTPSSVVPVASSSISESTPTSPSNTSASSASGTSTSSSAANNATAVKESNSGLSAGTQAAIAVPVVLVVLGAIILAALCVRRRKKRGHERGDSVEKVPLAAKNKKWTRHLRIFSFDSELLMGGRYSSTNSIRSRQTGSVRSQTPSRHSQGPSLQSVDEIAPPYRDAISTVQAPNIAQVIAAPVAAGGVSRSASNATAPPPYGAAAGRLATPTTPRSNRSPQNPFADSPPISPVDGSPFNDPPGAISRGSSVYRADRDDASTIGGASDAASIREATLARNASVMSGGRIINNVNRS